MKQHVPGSLFEKHKAKMAKHHMNWIAGALKHPGALHRELGVKQGEKIPASKLHAAAKKGGVEGKRARLAETLKSFHHKKGHKKHMKKKKSLRSADEVVRSEQNASHQYHKRHHKKMTLKEDTAYDKKHGIKEGSKRDMETDKLHGVKDKHYKHKEKHMKKKAMKCKVKHKHTSGCK